ncbi:olfactory receptor 1G1-like [Gopherus flavomarginatus]|uniref:olfactory receptor 1G1-like n=1 Tax=Gopherus flavomarginatus TaxID=286002 RepID=UPI0021CBE341|nr:olfactory receptor 1G1-like [Gopherus flavomarginatus]
MYFFLGNLSCLEICYISTILPRLLVSLLTGDRTISVTGCVVQFYFAGFLIIAECYMLAVMSYDRYLAICKPLRYATLMNARFCMQLAAGSWLISLIFLSILISFMAQLAFCGTNEIDHFFCDLTPVTNLSCSDTSLVTLATLIFTSINMIVPLPLTLASYVYIISTILRIPSTTGKQKAFSTCSSHLIVVTVFYGTLITVYMLPNTGALRAPNKVLSFFYTVLTPLINPFIYSLKNKEINEALWRILPKWSFDTDTDHEGKEQISSEIRMFMASALGLHSFNKPHSINSLVKVHDNSLFQNPVQSLSVKEYNSDLSLRVIYVVTMAVNILIAALVVTDHRLYTPMYFFLENLSCLEI